ncbi:FAD-dependent monooxygenase [Klebsiella michiganensis]|nr:FAD-dependent monooxygenase [Klebsiella michiganensis]HBU6430623.1 FAD-dependent monooxygenase [Klebsiella oxytoca]
MENQSLRNESFSEVLIVGAGPVGMAMAILLKQYGISVRIIDKNSGPSISTKAMAIHSRTLEIFRELEIAEKTIAEGFSINAFSIQAHQRKLLNYDFSLLDVAWPILLSLPQPDVEKFMLQRLNELGVQVEWKTSLIDIRQQESNVTALLQYGHDINSTQWEHYRWICACDGARSTVRKNLNLSFDGSSYDSYFMLTDADIEWDQRHDEGAFFLGTRQGYVAVAPINGKGRFRLFFEMTGKLPPEKDRPVLDLETFQSLCDGRGQTMKLSNLSSMTIASFQHRQVTQLRHRSVFLVGDAAHIGSPIGGQWMNLGLSEAYNLAWKLAWVAKGFANERLLDSYHDERYRVAKEAEKTAHRLTKLITTRNPVAVWSRDNLLPIITKNSIIRRKLPAMISGHNYHYCNSTWVLDGLKKSQRRSWRKKGLKGEPSSSVPRAGQLAPDIMLWSSPGQNQYRLSQLFRQQYLLMIFTAADSESARLAGYLAIAKTLTENYQGIEARCVTDTLDTESSTQIADPDWRLHRRYHAGEGCIFLIRPDGYIACQSNDPDVVAYFIQEKSLLSPR